MTESGIDLQVRGPRVLIRPEDQSVMVRESGLIAVSHHAPENIGTVVAVGDRVGDVKVDDIVLFTEESGQVVAYDGERFLLLYEDELLAIWEGENQPI